MQNKLVIEGINAIALSDANSEEYVIAECINSKIVFYTARRFVKSFYFTSIECASIFKCLESLDEDKAQFDIITINAKAKQLGLLQACGNLNNIIRIAGKAIGSSKIEQHCLIILEMFLRRLTSTYGTNLNGKANDMTVSILDTIDEIYATYKNIVSVISNMKQKETGDLINDALLLVEEESKSIFISTGFKAVNKDIGGWGKSDLIIVAGRPGMGKTSYALSSAVNVAKNGHPVAFFSLEMSSVQLMMKVLCTEAKVDLKAARDQKLTPEQKRLLKEAKSRVPLNLYLDDTPNLNINSLKAKIIFYIITYGVELIVLDYLQLLNAVDDRANRDQEIGVITKTLKGLAKEFNVPVIALSQLSRSNESRKESDFKPKLSDLRESGNIEQDADIVQFVYRAEYYGLTQFKDGNSTKGVASIINAKFRNGTPNTESKLKFVGETTSFEDIPESQTSIFSGMDDEDPPY